MENERVESLELLQVSSSGLDRLLQNDLRENNYSKFLRLLIFKHNDELQSIFKQNPDYIDSPKIKALWLLNLIINKNSISEKQVFPLGRNEKLANSLAYELIELYQILFLNLSNFTDDINFYDFKNVLPTLAIYYSDFILSNALKDKYQELFQTINEAKYFEDLVDEQLISQRFRLLSLYYRRLSNSDGLNKAKAEEYQTEAEKYLTEYRKHFRPNTGLDLKLISKSNAVSYLGKEVLDNWDKILEESKQIQEEVSLVAGLNNSTCFHFKCVDCCTKDFPSMSLTEFMYMKQWLQKNNMDFNKYVEKAQTLQNQHKELYDNEELAVRDLKKSNKTVKDLINPNHFQFACPMLEDNVCTIHEARPLACRAFGLSTIDGESVQACDYYLKQYQGNASHMNERNVFDVRPLISLMRASDRHLTLGQYSEEKQLRGTIVAWLTFVR